MGAQEGTNLAGTPPNFPLRVVACNNEKEGRVPESPSEWGGGGDCQESVRADSAVAFLAFHGSQLSWTVTVWSPRSGMGCRLANIPERGRGGLLT